MIEFHYRLETIHIPRIRYWLSWIPFSSRWLPRERVVAPKIQHQNNFLESSKSSNHFEVIEDKLGSKMAFGQKNNTLMEDFLET